jgi:hypothetical protein
MAIGNLMQGDNWTFKINITDGAGSNQDITGGTVWLTFKIDPLTQDDASADFQLVDTDIQVASAVGNDPTEGLVYLRSAWDAAGTNPPDTTMLTPGSYQYDVQYKDTTGVITTVETGTASVAQQVTVST